ncbi:integrase core domain-containing protein [Tateyamaria sp.]|uniref:integrase core domain-containing protein n=1 Tax=Tateyamaria sp. TaxID=1929288 RepID=UPI003B21DAA2
MESETTASGKPEGQIQIVAQSHCKSGSWVVTECVYLHAFERGSEAKVGIGKWMAYYNTERPHSTHGILTPNEAYASQTEPTRIAA